jgi:hypothetical protein
MFGRGYNLVLAVFWFLVFIYSIAREFIMAPEAAAKLPGPQDDQNRILMTVVSGAFTLFNLARWWYMRQLAYPSGVHVNPLAERLPSPDRPPERWEPNPELDFTKPARDQPPQEENAK